MKMGKLFSSIATATMVLTTLAPVAVANAATGYPVTDEGVSSTSSTSASLPAATSAAKNDDNGSVTAESDASVNVIDGYLILQSVPNFGFGAAIAGNTSDLVNYKKAGQKANDGSESGLLTILDSRHSTPSPDASGKPTEMDGMGYSLNVKLGSFKHDGTSTTTRDPQDLFVLNFKKNGSGLAERVNPSNNNTYPRQQVDAGVVKESDTNGLNLVKATGKTGGNHTWQFTGNDVSLSVPASAGSGQWYSTMTWTLKANAK